MHEMSCSAAIHRDGEAVVLKAAPHRSGNGLPTSGCAIDGGSCWFGEKIPRRAVAGVVPQQILQSRLDVNPRSDWKLSSCRSDLSGRHSEMFKQRLA